MLSDRIVFLELAPDTRILEEEVGASFGVSRSPIREVFRMLEADGLVVRTARKGVRVTPMSRRDLDEVYACRVGLEGLAAAEAARHIDDEGRKQVKALIAGMGQAFKAKDVPTFFNHNVSFTRAIHTASQNQTLIRIVAGIEKQAMRYRYLAHLQSSEMLSMTLEGHSGVADAVLAGDVPLARRRAEQLMRRAHDVIAKALSESSYALPGDSGDTFEDL
ncbi:DNA-binding transcriptional regulator, GntR family [Enhydrobacter aerosaccus]|uniref:DNA-binding transcriptional regulator, GntR family n=1 Tax=Enhydrobacter aerosaccus TaxID=225324 RepID=A0A1T4JKC1_9HYPH|nr:DNA-binding transcriptional regulator, GntR family [Enhydrobacter aerosaccus]